MQLAKIKILIIEDDPFIASLYTRKFDSEGFQVIQLDVGQGALKLAKKIQPDIILLDLLLPDRDGFSLLKELKNNQSVGSIPVIVLTNLGEPENIERAFSLGASSYLIKANFLPREIVSEVKRLIG